MRIPFPLALAALALALTGCLATVQNISDVNRADEAKYLDNDPGTAYRYYERAVRNGDAEAQHELAKMYREGTTVKRDYRYARTLEEQSAAQGFAPAMRTLGFHLVNGLYGVPPSPRRGISLLNAAADDGDGAAHYMLGRLYAHGTADIQRNAERAAHHFRLAEEAGYGVEPEYKSAASIERMHLSPFGPGGQAAPAGARAGTYNPAPTGSQVRGYSSAPASHTAVTKGVVMDVQRALKARGFYSSAIDGIIGKGSIKAIKAFQRSAGLRPTGVIDDALLTALNLKHL